MKVFYVICGLIFTALGALGVALPVLPTTPFLLLALACFTRGSETFQNWLINTKLYKNNIDDFVKERAMTFKTKVRILAFASTMLIIAFVMVKNIYARILIIGVIIFKYYYFTFKIETKPEEKLRTF